MKKVREGYKMTEFGEIPEAWEVRQLEDVCEILDSYRKPIKASEREEMKGDIPYYGASGVIDWVNDYIFDEELILLGEDGENLNSRNTNLAFKVLGKSWVNNHAHVFKIADKSRDNIDFMVYYLESKDYSKYIAGSAQPKITQAQCRKFLLPSPDLEEQEKIASILSTVDEQIDNIDGLIEKNKELKKGLMQQLLTKGIGHTKFKKSEVGEIPEEWEVSTLGENTTIVRGASPRPKGDSRYYGGDIPRLMIADVSRDGKYVTPRIDYLTEEGSKKSRPMKAGDLVISISGTVALPTFLNVDACIHDGFMGFVEISNKLDKEFLYYQILFLRQILISSATDGGVYVNLTTDIVKNFNIVLPKIEEQNEIVSILSSVDFKIEEYETKKQKLEELKKGLMQQLLTGKIRVF